METRETILKELRDISPVVANLDSTNVFSVPPGYFNQFPAAVLLRIQAETVDLRVRSHPFNVPAGYFDSLASNIINRIKNQEQSVEAELNELAPILNTISREPVYSVPQGYFESLELTIPLKLDKPSARVFSFGRVMQYAVAACTVGILVIGVFLYNNNTGSIEAPISYKEAVNMNVSTELEQLNEADIASYLEESPMIGYAFNVSAEEVDFEEALEEASDEEINQYLNETAEPGESAGKGS
jgi:hypothetical protein